MHVSVTWASIHETIKRVIMKYIPKFLSRKIDIFDFEI